MEIFGQSPAEIAEVLLSMAKPGETITVGGSGYRPAEAKVVVEEIWQRQGDYHVSIAGFRSVVGVLDPTAPYHGRPVEHLPNVTDPTVEIVLAP